MLDTVTSPSEPSQKYIGSIYFFIFSTLTFLFAPPASLSDMITSSLPIGVVFCVSQVISTVGVTATGFHDPSNHTCCGLVPLT